MEISRAHPEPSSRPWLTRHARIKAEQDVENGRWSLEQFVDFNNHIERMPADNSELFERMENQLCGDYLRDPHGLIDLKETAITSPNQCEARDMLRPTLLAVLAIAVTGAAASAADLPAQTRLGAIFAEPQHSRAHVSHARDSEETFLPEIRFAPEVDIQPLVTGYYGKPRSYDYRPYYGTSPGRIFERLPYTCGTYGYC